MPSYRPPRIVSSEITPEALFFNRRPFITIGMAALVMLIPLALTSNNCL